MSLTFIHDFQNRIYTSLIEDANIMSAVNKIYIGVIQDGHAPFILIELVKAEDVSVHDTYLYKVEFQISAYAKDTNHGLLVTLSDHVTKNLSGINRLFSNYTIEGIKINNINFDRARDLVLNRLVIKYKAFIRKGV